MSAEKFKTFEGNYDHYSTDPNPTTNAQMQEYIKNQNILLGDVINTTGTAWQKQQAYTAGFVLILPNGKFARVTSAGTSGTTEPNWAIGSISDGSVTWSVQHNLSAMDISVAESHNSFTGGRNLISIFGSISAIETAVAAGDFRNVFPGDYIPVTAFDAGYGTSGDRAYVLDIDGYYNVGDTAMTSHHLIMSMSCGSRKMNDTNIITGGYLGSKVHTEAMPAIQTCLETIFGSGHVLTARVLLTNATNDSTPSMAGAGLTGATTGWEWTSVKCWLPNEVNVYGTAVWSSSAHDNGGFSKHLALYRHKGYVKLWGRSDFWLSCVAYAGYFCYAHALGSAHHSGAAAYSFTLRPLFLLG